MSLVSRISTTLSRDRRERFKPEFSHGLVQGGGIERDENRVPPSTKDFQKRPRLLRFRFFELASRQQFIQPSVMKHADLIA